MNSKLILVIMVILITSAITVMGDVNVDISIDTGNDPAYIRANPNSGEGPTYYYIPGDNNPGDEYYYINDKNLEHDIYSAIGANQMSKNRYYNLWYTPFMNYDYGDREWSYVNPFELDEPGELRARYVGDTYWVPRNEMMAMLNELYFKLKISDKLALLEDNITDEIKCDVMVDVMKETNYPTAYCGNHKYVTIPGLGMYISDLSKDEEPIETEVKWGLNDGKAQYTQERIDRYTEQCESGNIKMCVVLDRIKQIGGYK